MNTEVISNEQVELVYTLDEALTLVGFGKFQALLLAYAGLGSMAEAMEVMILSFIGPSFKAEWDLSSGQESLITTVVFGGMLVGAYLWGLVSDKYGRRLGLLSVALVTSVFAFLSALAPNYMFLVLSRMVVGIGLGGGPVYSTWFLEFLPVQNRGFWMVSFSTFWTVGTIFVTLLAWIIIPRFGWRWLLALSSIPCFAAFAFYFLTSESPRYLCLNGRITELHNVLRKMAAVNRTQLPSGIFVSDQTETSKPYDEYSPSEITSLLLSAENSDNATPKTSFLSLPDLFSQSLAKTILLSWVVYFGNSFSYYGVILMTSELNSGQSKCATNISRMNHLKDSSLYRSAFITSLSEIPGLFLSAALVDKVGRRISMTLMYSFAFIFLLPLLFHQHDTVTTSLLFGARMCIIGSYTIAGVYCPELYPTSVRTTGVGIATAVGRIAGMICPVVAVNLVSGCHQMAAVGLFEVAIILAGISVLFFPVETKGRQLADTVTVNK